MQSQRGVETDPISGLDPVLLRRVGERIVNHIAQHGAVIGPLFWVLDHKDHRHVLARINPKIGAGMPPPTTYLRASPCPCPALGYDGQTTAARVIGQFNYRTKAQYLKLCQVKGPCPVR